MMNGYTHELERYYASENPGHLFFPTVNPSVQTKHYQLILRVAQFELGGTVWPYSFQVELAHSGVPRNSR